MRIQRYIARDMRSALALVREGLGPDAVILSSGKVGDEVEVVAAIDAEVARAVESAPPGAQRHGPVNYETRSQAVREADGRKAHTFQPPQVTASSAPPAAAKSRRASSQL